MLICLRYLKNKRIETIRRERKISLKKYIYKIDATDNTIEPYEVIESCYRAKSVDDNVTVYIPVDNIGINFFETVDEAEERLKAFDEEKVTVPMTPYQSKYFAWTTFNCPACNTKVGLWVDANKSIIKKEKCPTCGQQIDWRNVHGVV